MMLKWRPHIKLSRDGILFVSGLAGIFHETLLEGAERPTLLFAFLAMVGLPVVMRADEKAHTDADEASKSRAPEVEIRPADEDGSK